MEGNQLGRGYIHSNLASTCTESPNQVQKPLLPSLLGFSDAKNGGISTNTEYRIPWLMKYNIDKCTTLHYGNKNPEKTYHLTVNGQEEEISNSDNVKDLGITFETDMKFRRHISNCINKGNKIIGLMRRTFLHFNPKTFTKLYKTLVRPLLEYGNIVWYPKFKKDVYAIESVQRRATKLVGSIRDLPYKQRLERLKLPTLSYRRFRGDMIQVYKLLNNKEDLDYRIFFELNDNNNTRGHALKLKTKSCNKDIRKYFFSLRSIKPWNSLPNAVVTAPTLNTFKNRLDDFMGPAKYSIVPENDIWVQNYDGVTLDE